MEPTKSGWNADGNAEPLSFVHRARFCSFLGLNSPKKPNLTETSTADLKKTGEGQQQRRETYLQRREREREREREGEQWRDRIRI